MTASGCTSLRGYGNRHQQTRERFKPLVATGKVNCARCHEPIDPLEAWDLDHADHPLARVKGWYLGPAHVTCNRSRKAQRRRPRPIDAFFAT